MADDDKRAFQVVLIGGYGFFGQRLANRLARMQGLHLILAGRDRGKADAMVERLRHEGAAASLEAAAIDIDATDFMERLAALAPHAVVHTGGPFQGQDYRVAETCIAIGAHYVDLADGRRFVCDIIRLDARAREAGVLVVSGASSVPALSGAAVTRLTLDMNEVESIDIGINPGNKTERGLATVRAILGYCGAPIGVRRGGKNAQVTGWLKPRRLSYPAPVGKRWLAECDVPDLELLPSRYGGIRDVGFSGGLELSFLHLGMSGLALLRRIGLVRDWARHADWLKPLSDLFLPLGTAGGAMHVIVRGRASTDAVTTERRWYLVAVDGDGPFVPTLAAAALIRALHTGRIGARGAMPCFELLELDDILAEASGLAITTLPPC